MPTTAGTTILGVCTRADWNRMEVEADDPTNGEYERYYIPSGRPPGIMVEGEIAMYAEKPIDKMYGQVYYRHTVDTGYSRLYTVSDVEGDGLEPLGNCRFVELSKAAGVVWVEVKI